MAPGSSVMRKMSASLLATRSGAKPSLGVTARMRSQPRSGQISPDPTSR